MEPAAFHFDPSPPDRNSILCSFVAGKDSISLIASRFGIEPADLEAWLARREVISARQAIEAVAAIQSRFAANVNAPLSIGPMVSTLRTIGRQLDNHGEHRETVTHDQVHRNLDAIFKIANRLDKLSRFQPGDHTPLRPRRSRASDTAPDRGTDPALRVRGGPPATSATSPTPAPYQLADPHTPALTQQNQQPEPHPVSPAIPAAATPPQPPAATSPPAPTSDCLPACETVQRQLPDAQRLVAAPSDSPPRQRAGEQWAGEPPPAPTASSSSEPLASPHNPHTTPAEAARRKREADFRAAYDDVYEGDEPDFVDAVAPPRAASHNHQPQSIAPRIDKVRHYNTVEPFS